jgi:G:T-mismatch repair DNA endonuclease (very short patch repair protein)
MKQEKKNKDMTKVKQESNNILLQGINFKKQDYDKKTYPKLVLNILKIMRNFTSIHTCWAHSSKKFFKKLLIYM